MKVQTERALFWWTMIITMVLFWGAVTYMLYPATADAQTWKVANSFTIGWNPVTEKVDGSPIPADQSITYDLYLSNVTTDPEKANPTKVTTTPITATSQIVQLVVEGKYFVGCQAILSAYGETVPSDISWSDDPAVVEGGNPFGLLYIVPAKKPDGVGVDGG